VHPLGLVAKAGVWYLVAGTDAGRRTFRVSRVRSAVPTGEPAERPEGFDLAEVWREIVDTIDERRVPFRATVLVVPEAVPWLRSAFGNRMTVGDSEDDGRVSVELRSWDAHVLAAEVAAFGSRVEARDAEVRAELARLGAELTDLYAVPGA
jgi:predicted DNA-binding transcriptional regulator YafY